MLRLACIFASEAGLAICAPVHDALLLEADDKNIEGAVGELQQHMARASELVLGVGRKCRSSTTIVRSGGRYPDERGKVMFEKMTRRLDVLAGIARPSPTNVAP